MQLSKADLIAEAWRRGTIAPLKLDSAQKDIADKVNTSQEKIIVVLSSRRIGKSHSALVLAIETCLKKPDSTVKFLAPTRKMIDEIISDLMPTILKDCPDLYRPQQLKSKYTYVFHNKSKLQLAGIDGGNIDRVRGSKSDLNIVDEAGFSKNLANTIRSVLIPTTSNTGGKIVLLSTPPNDFEHDFLTFVEEAEAKNTLIKKTIFDSPRFTKESIAEIVNAYPGGMNHPDFRREYLCEMLKNDKLHAIPEFDGDLEKEIIKPWVKPPHYDYYEGMDLGFKDFTALVFGFYDFRSNKIIIEDELLLDFQKSEMNLKALVKKIKEKETEHFSDPLIHEVKKPFRRVSDINHIVTSEISKETNGEMFFTIPKKDDKQAAVNQLRMMLLNKQIIIHPRCQQLITQLRNVKWSKNHKEKFDRSPTNGHYDLVDALIYMVRSIDLRKNPYPTYYDKAPQDLFIYEPRVETNIEQLQAIFNFKKIKGKKW